MNRLVIVCALSGLAGMLNGCGAADSADGTADDEAVADVTQALDVANLTVKYFPVAGESLGHYQGQCYTRHTSNSVTVENRCQLQEYYGGAWHADPRGWTTDVEQHYAGIAIRRACTPGTLGHYRMVSRGRALINGAWTGTEEAISPKYDVVCPRG